MNKDLALIVNCIDLEKMALTIFEGIGEQALKDVVAKSSTSVDDAIVAMLLPAINPAVESFIKAKIAELKASIGA